jgi:hypothetical protein
LNKDTLKYNSISQDTTLDTLELTSETFFDKSHESLYWSAVRKRNTIEKVKALFDVSGDKIYWKAFHCNTTYLQNGQTLVGSLCRKRWCNHCNRITTAEKIKGYQEPLKQLADEDQLYLVTLTAPTVQARQLRSEIEKRYKTWNRVKDRLRKQGIKINGIRKLEVTFSVEKDWYHPHFHLIVQGKLESELLRDYWLEDYKKADIKGNHIIPIGTTAKDLLEVFKYAQKDIVKDETTATATHIIFEALKGKRIFNSYGKIRKVKEPEEEKTESIKYEWLKHRYEVWEFDEDKIDYTTAYGETLIGAEGIRNSLKQEYDKAISKGKEGLSIRSQRS